MVLLAAGILCFTLVHLSPALAPGIKAGIVANRGEGVYKVGFSLLVALGMVLIVLGWRSAQPQFVYLPPAGLRHPAMGVLVLAFWLMVVSSRPARVRRWVRHPQLTGVLLWAIAHLSLNGDNRSVLLFTGLGLWALAEMLLINRRDGVYSPPAPPAWAAEGVNLLITVVVVAVVVTVHPWLSGMPVM